MITSVSHHDTHNYMRLDTALVQPPYTRFFLFFSSSHFTTLPTSCEASRVVISSASSVSTTTRLLTPTVATNFPGECTKFPSAFSVKLSSDTMTFAAALLPEVRCSYSAVHEPRSFHPKPAGMQ